MSKKDEKIAQLEEKILSLDYEIELLGRRILELVASPVPAPLPRPKKKYAGDISFDFWPISDWFRFQINPWSRGRYLQICVGPIRFEFFEA